MMPDLLHCLRTWDSFFVHSVVNTSLERASVWFAFFLISNRVTAFLRVTAMTFPQEKKCLTSRSSPPPGQLPANWFINSLHKSLDRDKCQSASTIFSWRKEAILSLNKAQKRIKNDMVEQTIPVGQNCSNQITPDRKSTRCGWWLGETFWNNKVGIARWFHYIK